MPKVVRPHQARSVFGLTGYTTGGTEVMSQAGVPEAKSHSGRWGFNIFDNEVIVLRRSRIVALLSAIMMLLMIAGCTAKTPAKTNEPAAPAAPKYPTRNINGVIPWGAGGTTDTLSRAIAPLAEKDLGQTVVLNNMPGATGSIGMQYVHDQPADGYSLLFAAENPPLYGVLEISLRSYDEFIPVNLMGMAYAAVTVKADAPWKTVDELLNDAKARPGKVKLGSTGVGGVPFVVGAMMKSVDGIEFNSVPFDGDGPAITALLGGHVDVTISVVSAVAEHARSGRVKVLAVVADKPVDVMPGVPALGQLRPGYMKYLPWGPFFGVWAKKGTPDDVVKKLEAAFKKAADEPKFKEVLAARGASPLNIAGDDARKFVAKWQSTTAWLLHDAGATKKSPEVFKIPKP